MQATVSTRTAWAGSAALLLAGVLASAFAWPELPATMDVHWNAAGEADGTAPRAVGALVLPGTTAAVLAVFAALPRIDPRSKEYAAFRGYFDAFVLLITTLLTGVHAGLLATNLGYSVPFAPVVLVASGLLLAYVGVLCRHAEPNWFVGVRTPWTLSSDAVWRRTHDLAGTLFVVSGGFLALAAIGSWALEEPALATIGVGVVSLTFPITVAHSFYVYRTIEDPETASA